MIWREKLIIGAKGVLMGAADVIPGVSGGTMAFITGIYDKLIAAINSVDLITFKLFFTGKFKKSMARIHWGFIIPLVIGVFISVLSLARVITSLLRDYPVYVWSFFFGLIVASIFVVVKEVKKWDIASVTGLVIGTIGAWFLVGMIPLSTPTTWWFTLIAGAVAIVAMILPGISGSFILVLLSQYKRILEAIKSLELGTLLFFYIGTMIGMIGFARVLGWLLSKHRNVTLAVLSGFMVGSLRKVWPFKEVLETTVIHGKTIVIREMNVLPNTFSKELLAVFGLFVAGLIIVIALEMVSGLKKKGESQ